jgi:hypothetical protein
MSSFFPDGSDAKPNWSEALAYFQTLSVVSAPFHHPAVDALLAQFRVSHVNGGACFGRWQLPDHPVLRSYARRQALDVAFFGHLLCSTAVRDDVPELQIPPRFDAPPSFQVMSSLSLECDVANAVHGGGAYPTTGGASARDAKRLAAEFCAALVADRFDEVSVYTSDQAWAPWFRGVAWDMSWFGVDLRDRTCWLLCKTDTD